MFLEQELNLSRHLGNRFSFGLNAMLGATVMQPALFVELAKAFCIRQQRASTIFADSSSQFIRWSIEKDNVGCNSFQHLGVGALRECAAAERDYRGISIRHGLQQTAQSLGLHLAESRFAQGSEYFGDCLIGTGFDLAVEIDETPPEALTQ